MLNPDLAPSCGRWWGATVDQGSGALSPAVASLETSTGRDLDIVHTYHRWYDTFPTQSERSLAHDHLLFLNWQPVNSEGARISWASIAAGRQDHQIDAVAARLRSWGVPVLLSFSHEPELDVGKSGTPAEFAAAWRHIHDRFVADGARKVHWVWTVMGLDQPVWMARYATLWPGDAYVDWIAWDTYNWAGCRGRSWQSFADTVSPFYTWLQDHGHANKPYMLAEYGTVESPTDPGRKAQWFRDEATALSSFPDLRALVYFDLPAPPANCDWLVTTSTSSSAAFGQLARSPAFAPVVPAATRSGG